MPSFCPLFLTSLIHIPVLSATRCGTYPPFLRYFRLLFCTFPIHIPNVCAVGCCSSPPARLQACDDCLPLEPSILSSRSPSLTSSSAAAPPRQRLHVPFLIMDRSSSDGPLSHLPVQHHRPPCCPTNLPNSFFVHRSWIGIHPMGLHLHKFIDQS